MHNHYRIKSIPIYDLGKMEGYLNQMSLRGYHFVNLRAGLWEFEKGEAVEYQYLCTYIPEITRYEKTDSDQLDFLTRSYLEAGWERICNREKLCFFRKSPLQGMSMSTNDEETKGMVSKSIRYYSLLESLKFNFTLAMFILIGVSILGFSTSINQFYKWPTIFFSSVVNVNNTILWPLLATSSGLSLMDYYRWRKINKKTLNESHFSKSSGLLNITRIILLTIAIVILIFNIRALMLSVMSLRSLFFMIGLPLVGFLGYLINRWITKLDMGKSFNMAVQIIIIILLVVLMQVGLFKSISADVKAERENEVFDESFTLTAESGSVEEWQIHHEDIPLEIESLIVVDSPNYYTDMVDEAHSILADYKYVSQVTYEFSEADHNKEMYYHVIETQSSLLAEKTMKQMIQVNRYSFLYGNSFQKIEIEGISDAQIYWTHYSTFRNRYLFHKDKRIVEITFTWEPSNDQLIKTYNALVLGDI